jgi:hypothetical protein
MWSRQVRTIVFLSAIDFLTPYAPLLANNSSEVPVVDGKVGSCQASFTVKDEAGKPIYNATIKVTLRYGLFNKRRMDLEIGTNSLWNFRSRAAPSRSRSRTTLQPIAARSTRSRFPSTSR